MEELLSTLMRDAQASKFTPIRHACQKALDVLNSIEASSSMPASQLRALCLDPLHLALDSRIKRLTSHAVSGIEKLLKDKRFQSGLEPEEEGDWLPLQVLTAVYATPSLAEDTQVDVIKLLLKMTLSSASCMSVRVITEVAQVYIDTYAGSTSSNVKAVIQAAFIQMLGSFAEKLHPALQMSLEHGEGQDVLSDFNAKGNAAAENLAEDIVKLLVFLTDKVLLSHKTGHTKHALPLLLEGIQSILTNCPAELRNHASFQELIWQKLCPCLIQLLGIPKTDSKSKSGGTQEHGRGVEGSTMSSSLGPATAKVIYNISVCLAKMVAPVRSLRPVIESLFHRILVCPALQHRHDALKAVKELVSTPELLCDLCVSHIRDPTDGVKATQHNDLALLTLIMDCVQECCHSNESAVCFTSVMCVSDLLGSLEQLTAGNGVSEQCAACIHEDYSHSTGKVSTPIQNHIDTSGPSPLSGEPNHIDHASRPQVGTVTKLKAMERHSALHYIDELCRALPDLLNCSTIPEVDVALQKFASECSAKTHTPTRRASNPDNECTPYFSMVNADSIYSTTYTALCLSLQLASAGYYDSHDSALVSMSECEFTDCVLDTDMFLYLSPDWLAEVYKFTLRRNLLVEAGWDLSQDTALIVTLKDMNGDGSSEHGGQMLQDHAPPDFDANPHTCDQSIVEAGKLVARRILSQTWFCVLDVLSVLLNGKSGCGVTSSLAMLLGTDSAKEEGVRARDAICHSLDGLQRAATLCCTLGLQERCSAVFAQLANTSCVMEDFPRPMPPAADRNNQKPGPTPKHKLVQLHATHVLSMDAILTTGLEMGSHSSDCWKHVFRCCAFISELEHTYFSHGNNSSSLPRIHQAPAVGAGMPPNADCMYDVPMVPGMPVAPRINVANLIRQSRVESGWDRSVTGGGVLNSKQASLALCGLSQQVDRIFEEAASHLNLASLLAFLCDLCESSKQQLAKVSRRLVEDEGPGEPHRLPVNSLHLYRLHNVMMTVVHSQRPLIHLLKAWTVVSSYLVEAAGHRDGSISKMAVTCVHDYIITLMANHSEIAHFHTNEMLCKTFENILCLELCDGDVQDQIVCCICELVEASATEIRSGWRPIFGALRAVRIEYTTLEEVNEARQRHVEAVLDVFDVYLNTDNIIVFASAMVDCILCLMKYVRGPGEFDDSDTEDEDSVNDAVLASPSAENLCIPALQYLRQCSIILQSMWNMPACPVFHGAKRIQADSSVRCVDASIPNMDFAKFAKYFVSETNGADKPGTDKVPKERLESFHVMEEDSISCSGNEDDKDADEHVQVPVTSVIVFLNELDKCTGILHVWFLLLEGLSGAISACPRSYQPQTMDMLFQLLRSAAHVPGLKFGVYCMNHLLLPMLQSWLRSGSRTYGYWDTGATNFKQCVGHTTDLMVDLIADYKDDEAASSLVESVLRQLLLVLTECIAQPFEVISRLGCSCVRHVLLSAGKDFSASLWQITIDGLHHALEVTTYCMRQLMILFHSNSESFYGDVGQVKVATRKDCSPTEFFRMWQLAQQVFLLDSQLSMSPPDLGCDVDKSYVFLLYPPGYENSLNPDHILARVPFRSIVVGLLSHQLLLQTVGSILLEGETIQEDSSQVTMPGMLSCLSTRHVLQLLDCLRHSYRLACDFDVRPGLKFLVQKVAHTEVAVNLYKQAGASMVFYIHTLIKICSNIPRLGIKTVRSILSAENAKASLPASGEVTIDGNHVSVSGAAAKVQDNSSHDEQLADENKSSSHVEMMNSEEGLQKNSSTEMDSNPAGLDRENDDVEDKEAENRSELPRDSIQPDKNGQENDVKHGSIQPDKNGHENEVKHGSIQPDKNGQEKDVKHGSIQPDKNGHENDVNHGSIQPDKNGQEKDVKHGSIQPDKNGHENDVKHCSIQPDKNGQEKDVKHGSIQPDKNGHENEVKHGSIQPDKNGQEKDVKHGSIHPDKNGHENDVNHGSIQPDKNGQEKDVKHGSIQPDKNGHENDVKHCSIQPDKNGQEKDVKHGSIQPDKNGQENDVKHGSIQPDKNGHENEVQHVSVHSDNSTARCYSETRVVHLDTPRCYNETRVLDEPELFVSRLRSMCEELCQTYIDILYDKEGTSCVDSMADQQLFFLIAQPDEFPDVGARKPDLTHLNRKLEETQARLQGLAITQAVTVQGDGVDSIPGSTQQQLDECPLSPPPLSPVHTAYKSKREMRDDHESRVYNLATDKLIARLMSQYKKRKNQNTLPSFIRSRHSKPTKPATQRASSSDPVEQVIEEQQKTSIMKDSEAHLQSWTELLCTILGLLQQLTDEQFTTLMPAVFTCVNQLICHAQDMRLREDLAHWLHRVGHMFSLSPELF